MSRVRTVNLSEVKSNCSATSRHYTHNTMLRNRFKGFSLKGLFTRTKKFPTPKKEADLLALDDFILKINVMSKMTVDSTHPIHNISYNGRRLLDSTSVLGKPAISGLDTLDKYLQDHFAKLQPHFERTDDNITEPGTDLVKSVLLEKPAIETAVRIYLTRQYLRRLRKCFDDKELDVDMLNATLIKRLFDVALRGTASERIEEHMKLFGEELNQERLQECFYTLFEPEVQTCTALFLLKPTIHKHHRKLLPKFAKTYLLDTAELNVKLRCLLAWSGEL